MRNSRMSITIFSIFVAALMGAIVTITLLAILLVPLVVIIEIIGG